MNCTFFKKSIFALFLFMGPLAQADHCVKPDPVTKTCPISKRTPIKDIKPATPQVKEIVRYLPVPAPQPVPSPREPLVVKDGEEQREENHIITINQNQTLVQAPFEDKKGGGKEKVEGDQIKKERDRYERLREYAVSQKKKAARYKKAYEAEKSKKEKVREVKKSNNGIYLGIVVGAGPDGVKEKDSAALADGDTALIEQDYRPFVGGRVMGVLDNGVAAGLQVQSNASISFDVSFRIK